MQMQPYSRPENMPVPSAGKTGPLAERNGHNDLSDWTGYSGSANGKGVQPSPKGYAHQPPAFPPTYLQILVEQIKKRWQILAVWLAATAAVAAAAVFTLGKPVWRAEGALYYAPDYGYSQHPLYRPPNIQSVLRDIKSAEVVESLRDEKKITENEEALLSRMQASVIKNSEYITVSFDWPNRGQAEEFANRLMELAVEKYGRQRRAMSKEDLEELEKTLEKTSKLELALRNKLNGILGNKGIFDLRNAKSNVESEIANYRAQLTIARNELASSRQHLKELARRIDDIKNQKNQDLGPPTDQELALMAQMREVREKQKKQLQETEIAKIQLKAKEADRPDNYKLLQKGALSRQEWNKLEAEIAELRVRANGTQKINEQQKKLDELDARYAELTKNRGPGTGLLQQIYADKIKYESTIKALPDQIKEWERCIDERRQWQQTLAEVEKDLMPLQMDIDKLQQKRTELTTKKQENDRLRAPTTELRIESKAKVGDSPVSSNHAKLVMAVFALSLLLFVGLVAVRYMPQAVAEARAQLPAPAHSNLPVPVGNNPRSLVPAERGQNPVDSSEHLRALAARIAQSASERGSIVLFTPAVPGLRVETLAGDLGCYYAQHSGRVLIFDTRAVENGSSIPAWAGPRSGAIGDDVESFLIGHTDRPAACFASTLIASIDYSRCEIFKHLNGVLAMYRFRRLVEEMKNSYSLVLMITPERYQGGEDDFLGNLSEGIVVVMNEGADPAEVDAYIQNLRANETPIYGAVMVPGRI
jgi:capsular polysaccharide biosynthesis protein